MKVTKRILAIVMTALMLVGTCGVAASAAESLQAAIDAAAADGTVVMTQNTTESVVIDKDLTLDLGGYELKSVPGSPAISIVNGANVTITNGHVVSQFANVKSLTMIETVVNESPAAISVKGGSVTVEGVRAVGSMTRIPTTTKYHFPTGSAIALVDGASATIKQSSLVGRYGVNNKVTNAAAGGDVTIEDAIMMGFMRAVKDSSKEIVSDGTEKVNAADRIEGFLNKPFKLEDRERNLLKRVMADRVMIYTKSVEDNCVFKFSTCSGGPAIVEAHEDLHLWQNNTSTDCSYKYVPEYVVLADGTLVKMTEKDGLYSAHIDEDKSDDIMMVKYRLCFDLQPDIRSLCENFDTYLEDLYNKVIKTAGEVYDYALEKYTKYAELAGNVLMKLDTIDSEAIQSSAEFNRLRRAIVDLGGATIWNAVHEDYTFGAGQMRFYYGPTAVMPADGIVGTLDRVTKLKEELESFMPFSDQSKWADMGYWFYENYEEVLDIIDEAQTRIAALQTILDGDVERAAIEMANLQDKRAMLDKVQNIVSEGKAALDKLLSSHTIQYFIEKADSHQSELKPYINKFINIYNNHEKYFTPSKYLDGNFAKAYSMYGYPDMDNENVEHSFGEWVADNDDTHTRTCENCGATETVEHDFDKIVVEQTCEVESSITFFCEDCGYSKTIEVIPGPGHEWGDWEYKDENDHERFCVNCGEADPETEAHNYVEDPDLTVSATCEAPGTRVLVCEGCGDMITETIETVDHTWDDGVTTEPTCTEDGYITYTCTNCGETKTEDGEKALGHDFDSSEWLYSDEDQHLRICDRCGNEIEYEDHTFDQYENRPTCTEPGSTVFVCTACEYTYSVEGDPATGHNFGDWEMVDEELHTRTCTNPDCLETESAAHDLDAVVTEATCTEAGSTTYTCNDCGFTYTEDGAPATGHHFGNWEYADEENHEHFCEAGDATETEAHNYVEDPDLSVPATCETPGTRVLVCEGCGDIITETIETVNHTWDSGEYTEPTCTEAGYTTYTCKVCGETKTEDGEKALGHDFEPSEWLYADETQHLRICDRCGDEIEYADHVFEQNTIPASCTENGSITYTCNDCEYTYTEVIEANGHTPGDEVIENDVKPTCTEPGHYDKVVYCTVCEEELTRETVNVPANGHTPGDEVIENDVKPTCTEPGSYDKVVYCTVCEEELTRETVNVPANGHTPGDEVIENDVKPTCTEPGHYDKVVYCTVCEEELTRETVNVPANGHTPGDEVIENDVKPTCTEPGHYDKVVYCTVCEEELTRETVNVPANGHTPGDEVIENDVKPTCTEPGSYDKVVYCTVCEEELTRETVNVPALGHDWGEWTVTKPATEDEEGEETRTCQRCDETETRPIPKLGPKELTLTDNITNQEPANRISVKVPYSRKGNIAVTLIPSEEDVTWTSSKPNLLTVDEDGNVRFVRLCVFCRSATITATTPDGRTATAVVTLKLKWWQYIIYLLFGWLWY